MSKLRHIDIPTTDLNRAKTSHMKRTVCHEHVTPGMNTNIGTQNNGWHTG